MPEDPRAGHSFGNEKRRSIKLRPYTDRYINLEIKNAEYHQQTFSDPFMILRMVRVAGFEFYAPNTSFHFVALFFLILP